MITTEEDNVIRYILVVYPFYYSTILFKVINYFTSISQVTLDPSSTGVFLDTVAL